MSSNVLVCWLDDGRTEGPFTESLVGLISLGALNGKVAGWRRLETGPILDKARNDLSEAFLASQAEWMLMVDSDMTFPASLLDGLLEAADPEARPVVGPLCYSVHHDGVWPVVYQLREGRFWPISNPPQDTLFQVGGLGTGCLLIHRTVLERMGREWPGTGPFDRLYLKGEPVGEDLSFCAKCGELDIPVWCHSGLDVGHLKIRALANRQTFEQWRRQHRFVVTGTGRCGTRYLSALFRQLQVPCTHEAVYTPDGPQEWGSRRGDSSWMAAPFLEGFDGTVIHLLRNPLAVVNSLVGIGFFDPQIDHGPYRRFAQKHCPQAFGLDPIGGACRFVIDWNRMAASHADVTVKVEEVTPESTVGLLRTVGCETALPFVRKHFDRIPTDLNHRHRADLGWGDVTAELVEHAKGLGYVAA